MSFLSNALFNVLIGKSISRTASVQVLDSSATTYLADGEVVVLKGDYSALTPGSTVADSDSITIVQRSGATASTANLIRSPKITGANVTVYKGVNFIPAQEQVAYIGYNGSAGSIDTINSNNYQIRVTFKHDKELWSEQNNINFHEFVSDSSTTQSEVAAGFAKQYAQIYPASNADIKVERVSDGTFTALGGSSTLVVSKGSTLAVASSSSHGLVAGSIVRIGGTLSTVPEYIVASVSGVNITLDSAYQGTSGTIANANAGVMTAITAWGIKITGVALPFSIPFFSYLKVMFDLTISNFGATTITDAQTASKGNGVYEEVASAEYIALGYEGFLANRNAVPATPLPHTNATASTNYDVISISGFDNSDMSPISGAKPAKFQVLIFMVDGASQTIDLLSQLNPWMASTARSFPNVAV